MSLYRGAGGASDATDDSTVNAVAGYASSAASSATASAASASTASGNASAAAASAASAATNVSQAASSASNALTSESNASTSATNAASSASAAAGSATAANVSAGSAATSAANAATSNSSASTHATNAANSATAAAGSATSAANSAASALAIYGNTAAMNEAVADAVEAAANAQQEAQDASDSAVASAASAAAADEHENNAAEWASQAQGSANSAQGFATAAQAARDATLEAYDNFDDRYLGVKTSNPTVDNDGNPLVPGALYFNSSTNMMMLYAAGNWVAAYTSGGSPSFGSIVVNGSGSFASGSASSPTITNIGSENTGLFFPSAFNLGFSTSGSERMRLNAVGNLGIGTVSPTALLDVNGTVNVTGVSTFSAGTAAAPAITTTGDTNTGIFFPAADTIAFSEGGVEAMRLDANGNMGVGVTPTNVAGTRKLEVGGTTGAALVLNTSSGNTSARNWAVAANFNSFGDFGIIQSNALGGDPITAGNARMVFSPAGNMGLGTLSPANPLNIVRDNVAFRGQLSLQTVSASNFAQITFYDQTTFSGQIYQGYGTDKAIHIANPLAHGVAFWTNNLERMRLDASGRLGIGVTPISVGANGEQLQIGNAASTAGAGLTIGSTATADIQFSDATSGVGQYAGLLRYAHTTNTMQFWTDSTERMRLDASGNLGIGTTSPAARLHVTTGTNSNGAIRLSSTGATAGTFSSMDFTTGTGTYSVGQEGNGRFFVYDGGADRLIFGAGGANSITTLVSRGTEPIQFVAGGFERARIDSAGSLLVNTTTSSGRLTVQQASSTVPAAYLRNANSFTGGANSTMPHLHVNSGSDTAGNTTRIAMTVGTGSNVYLDAINVGGAGAGSDLAIYTRPSGGGVTERMRLDSNGNLGLGVTPSAWASGWRALQTLGGNSFYTDSTVSALVSNAIFDGAWKYVNTAGAGTYQINRNAHNWFIAGSGTAGNTISFTQAMTLDASGNLGIGTTSPAARVHAVATTPGRFDKSSDAAEPGLRFTTVRDSYATQWALGQATGSLDFGISYFNGTTWTERARIDASGNLGLGTTSTTERLRVQSSDNFQISFRNQSATGLAAIGTNSSNNFLFFNNGSERARITSIGNLLLGGTEQNAQGRQEITFDGATAQGLNIIDSSAAATSTAVSFIKSAGTRGTITVTASATAYNTSSDYRLKNITGPVTNSGAYIDSLNPVEGTWKVDGSPFVGLIAHEVQEASRTAVATGVKDGEEMQGMDYSNSELIANLIAEVKSLRARVAALESN